MRLDVCSTSMHGMRVKCGVCVMRVKCGVCVMRASFVEKVFICLAIDSDLVPPLSMHLRLSPSL